MIKNTGNTDIETSPLREIRHKTGGLLSPETSVTVGTLCEMAAKLIEKNIL